MANRAGRGFRLSKWYLDAVGDDGGAFFGYCGDLTWAGASLSYASSLFVPRNGPVRARAFATRCAAPRENEGLIRWESRRVGIEGSWKRLAAPVSRLLLEGPAGWIQWDCRAPVAQARLTFSDGTTREGLGYVERLEMTVAPWNLPIEELRWGRFHVGRSSLVWIDWRGPKPLTLVVRDGVEQPNATVDDGGVGLPDGARLSLVSSQVLRQGPAIPTALAALLAPRLRFWHESKWLSEGALATPGQRTIHGRAIHEKVDLAGGRP